MPEKRFRARQRFANTRVWAVTSVILISGGLALHAASGQTVFPMMALAIGAAGCGFGTWQDRRERVSYGIERGQLLFRTRGTIERASLDAVQDASLVDRQAARDLLLERKRAMEASGRLTAEREEFQRRSLRWCSVDIGLGAFGIGNGLLDRRPDGKYDLVLLRFHDGRILLLSPVHNQDLISALNKGKGLEERVQNRA